jgi:hypothetical protein
MSRRWIVTLLLVLLATGLVLAERAGTRQPDWRPSYEHDVSEPRGGQVLYTLLPELAGGVHVRRLTGAPYRHLRDPARTGETYFVVTSHFEPDSVLAEMLLGFAARGNTVFIAAERVSGVVARRLAISSDLRPRFERFDPDFVLQLANPRLRKDGGHQFAEPLAWSFVTPLDTGRVTVLGYARDTLATYVRVHVGSGQVYVMSTPRALTNAALLDGDGAAYAAAALSYLPAQPVVWDTHYKPMRSVEGAVLRYVQEDPALGWAYYTLLVATILIVLFRGRRWQRPIPVVRPPENHALAFARTVGQLYHQRGDDALLVERQAQHLLERLRRALHDPDLTLAPEHRDRIGRSLGVARDEVDALFDMILRLRSARRIAPDDLLTLDRRMHALTRQL